MVRVVPSVILDNFFTGPLTHVSSLQALESVLGGRNYKSLRSVEIGSEIDVSSFTKNKKHDLFIPARAFPYLQTLDINNSFALLEHSASQVHICFQFNSNDQKSLSFISCPSSGIFHYEYDPHWAPFMPMLEACNNEYYLSKWSHEVIDIDSDCIFIGGSANISHFFGNFFPKIYVAFRLLNKIPVFTVLPAWQLLFLQTIFADFKYKLVELGSFDVSKNKRYLLINDRSRFLLEDIQSFKGNIMTRSILSKYLHVPNDCPVKKLYICRAKYEQRAYAKSQSFVHQRAKNWRELIQKARDCDFKIIFPEEYSVEKLYYLMARSPYIVSDFGSNSTHISINQFLLDNARNGFSKVFLGHRDMLDLSDNQSDHFYRNYEWYLGFSYYGLNPWKSLAPCSGGNFMEADFFPKDVFS